mgnify:CR=1 FL=1
MHFTKRQNNGAGADIGGTNWLPWRQFNFEGEARKKAIRRAEKERARKAAQKAKKKEEMNKKLGMPTVTRAESSADGSKGVAVATSELELESYAFDEACADDYLELLLTGWVHPSIGANFPKEIIAPGRFGLLYSNGLLLQDIVSKPVKSGSKSKAAPTAAASWTHGREAHEPSVAIWESIRTFLNSSFDTVHGHATEPHSDFIDAVRTSHFELDIDNEQVVVERDENKHVGGGRGRPKVRKIKVEDPQKSPTRAQVRSKNLETQHRIPGPLAKLSLRRYGCWFIVACHAQNRS